MLKITLRNGKAAYIEDFKEIFIPYDNLTVEDVSKLILNDAITYVFKGKTVLSVRGSDILHLEFTKKD